MKILVIKGSPNKKGSSNLLADNFIKGATEAGHSVSEIDAAHADISPCVGCLNCG
ncbi:MAG: NAD(P)H-dependent oxidoreductase, partial [Methanobrevibacter sp.]|nr:NAD(P)H-dependent oxidoreductase [Methanobrevibacter sp.]